MGANATIVVFTEIAIEAKNLEFVGCGEIVSDEPHIKARLSNLLAMLATIVVNVVNSEKTNPVLSTAGAFPSKMPNDRFLKHTATGFAVLSEIGPDASGVSVSVSLCRFQPAFSLFFVVLAIIERDTIFASAVIIALRGTEIKLSDWLNLGTLATLAALVSVGLAADCHAHKLYANLGIYGVRFPAIHTVFNYTFLYSGAQFTPWFPSTLHARSSSTTA
jgi:hypothetical protein